MNRAAVVVLERETRWAALLRLQLRSEADRVTEVRSVNHCREVLAESLASFLVIQPAADVPATVRLLTELVDRDPQLRCAIVGPHENVWPLREAGAIVHVASLHQVDVLVRLVRRHLRNVAAEHVLPNDIINDWRDRIAW